MDYDRDYDYDSDSGDEFVFAEQKPQMDYKSYDSDSGDEFIFQETVETPQINFPKRKFRSYSSDSDDDEDDKFVFSKKKDLKLPVAKIQPLSNYTFSKRNYYKDFYSSLLYLTSSFKGDCVIMNRYGTQYGVREFPYLMMISGDLVVSVDESFLVQLKNCYYNSNKRFIIWALTILNPGNGPDHANMMIYDKTTHSLERFEPHGVSNVEWVSRQEIDVKIKEFVNSDFGIPGFIEHYYAPLDFCPVISFQRREEQRELGYCAIWSIWYAELRLLHPDKSREQIIMDAINSIDESKTGFYAFINDYANFIGTLSIKLDNALVGRRQVSLDEMIHVMEFLVRVKTITAEELIYGPVDINNYKNKELITNLNGIINTSLIVAKKKNTEEYIEGMKEGNGILTSKRSYQSIEEPDSFSEIFLILN